MFSETFVISSSGSSIERMYWPYIPAEALKAKSSVLGTWKMRVEDGDRWASITIEFKRSNQFYFEAKGQGDSSPVTLKGSFSEGEFSLGFKGEASNQSWEISR